MALTIHETTPCAILYHAERLNRYVTDLEALENPPEVLVGGRLTSQYNLSKYCSESDRAKGASLNVSLPVFITGS